ncbi:pyridoxamine 5'-phosphate oxidase family protein [Magnetovibrio sp.]|uniref:pyridoxamine 5'-phosphate oxidase family protein n=1 Tax=Magnetovibrio sp. TaxID=2024836 RepID=UPI002F92248F
MNDELTVTERTRLRRLHQRGSFDRKTIHAILDAMALCHVGFVLDGKPVVIPTFQWREGNHVYWHGSAASRGIRASQDRDVCLTVSLLDGMVLARSAMHHSANFRSVMIYGRPTIVDDPDRKAASLNAFIDKLYPGRSALLRPMTAQEAKATTVLSMPIDEASAKIRDDGVCDDEEDYALPIWAGVLPVRYIVGDPVPDPRNVAGVEMPAHVKAFTLG